MTCLVGFLHPLPSGADIFQKSGKVSSARIVQTAGGNMSDFPDPLEVELEFFHAMRAGYATNAPKKTIESLPRSKVIPYENGFYRIYDVYYAPAGSDASAGSTVIWYKGTPVWMMSYQGRYTKECSSFLKQALRFNYEANYFVGGRGPEEFKGDGGWLYQNKVCQGSSFSRFSGREGIVKNGSIIFGGYHEYQGMLLF
jgi:hypothetical protein